MTGPGGGPGDNIQLRMHDVTVCIRRYQKHQKKNKTVLLLKKKPFARVPHEKSARKTRRINARSLFKESASIFVVNRKTRASFSRLGEEISVQKSPGISADEFPEKVRDREICSRRRGKLSLCARGFCSSSSRFITCVREYWR